MDSSTSRRTFSDRRHRIASVLLVIGAPLVWLLLLQTDYVLTYAACAARSNASLQAGAALAAAAATVLVVIAWRSRRHAENGTDSFLADVAVLTTVLFAVVVAATALPPVALHPCD
jgi:hypothetical protein